MMKKILPFLLFLYFVSLKGFSQDNLGHNMDNYAGIYSLGFNPAEGVDSRYKFHMNIVSAAVTLSNNYLGISRKALLDRDEDAFNDSDFKTKYLKERLNGKKKAIYLNGEVGTLPSFMLNFGKKHSNLIGFNIRGRFNVAANGISEDLAVMAFNSLEVIELQNKDIENKNLSVQANAWAELGLTYGRDLIKKDKHYASIAGTFKLTKGLIDAYIYSDNANVRFPSDSTLTIKNSDVKFGYNNVLGADNFPNFDPSNLGKIGVGFDIGGVYEFRPNKIAKYYELDGDSTHLDPRKEQYKFKVGFSVMDIGFTRYERSIKTSGSYNANVNALNIDNTFGAAFSNFSDYGLDPLTDTLNNVFTSKSNSKSKYNVLLPLTFNVYFDYKIWRGFYASAGATVAPGFVGNSAKNRSLTTFNIAPRFESKWFSFYLPFSVTTHGNVNLGTGMRIGPIAFGTTDVLALIGKKNIYNANAYMNLSIPLFKKTGDRDRDHVSNRADECRREPGPWITVGCPDKDEDGTPDNIDECPSVKGVETFKGCPDTDSDGIKDSEDECPEVAGVKEFNGCPDTDNDGIKDSEDECPELAGSVEMNGCPDKDGDGINDTKDECPEVAGKPEFNGCPFADRDKDGVEDSKDNCPDLAGPKENNGCPDKDDDNDGVPNRIDECPQTPGPADHKGCPLVDVEVRDALDVAFKDLEFETGKAIILKSSYPSLEVLANTLKKHDDYRLSIEGHTDNVGSESSNMVLSQKRADAVKDAMIKRGVSTSKISTKAFGESRPIATNSTAAGRQQNRRVELKVYFD